MVSVVKKIYRYPVKGLTPEELHNVRIEAGNGIPGDRRFAFARRKGVFDSDKPEYLPKSNFLMLQRDAQLAQLNASYSDLTSILKLSYADRYCEIDTKISNNFVKAEKFIAEFLGLDASSTPSLEVSMGHMFSDLPVKVVSIVNLNTVREVAARMKVPLSPLRFRANIYLDNLDAWEEFSWVDRTIKIDDTFVNIMKRTERCAAIEVNPEYSARATSILKFLNLTYGHCQLGVYGKVISPGDISIGDRVRLID